MTGRPRRVSNVKNYKLLAEGRTNMEGTEGNKEGPKEGADTTSLKSGRSGKSTRSKKTSKQTAKETETRKEIQEIDGQIEDLNKKIDNNPAFLTITEEAIRKKYGERYITESEIEGDLTDDKVYSDLKKTHQEEISLMENREKELKRRQELVDLRDALMKKRVQLELMIEAQKLQEREAMLDCQQQYMLFERRKLEVQKREEEMKSEGEQLQKLMGRPPKEVPDTGSLQRTEQWVAQQFGKTGSTRGKCREAAPSVVGSQAASMTGSQVVIRELQQKLQKAQEQIQNQELQAREGYLTRYPEGMPRLKKMGLIAQHAHEDRQEPYRGGTGNFKPNVAELKKMGETGDEAEEGKDNPDQQCHMCTLDNSKVKSGKYVKSNINLKIQEQWPHINVIRKYTKRTTFEAMDYEVFVAGETRIILGMKDRVAARGRLDFLCKLSHWLCKCRDWPAIKGLYEAVLESIELGEDSWYSDFTHYEMMVPQQTKTDKEKDRENKENKLRSDTYWCKPYQRGACSEKNPHMAQLRPDDPPVAVQHICAACYQRDGRRLEHQENECSKKER